MVRSNGLLSVETACVAEHVEYVIALRTNGLPVLPSSHIPLRSGGIERGVRTRDTDGIMPEKPPSVILIIENEDETRRLYADALYPLNRPVVEAANSYEAFEQVAKHDVAMVVTDIYMPGGGVDYLKQLRRRMPGCPILAVSGSVTDAVHDEVVGAGADAFLRKPFTTARLRSAVQDLLMKRLHRDQTVRTLSDDSDHDWLFICDECEQQWPLSHRDDVRAHEQHYGYSVYERYRPPSVNRRNDDREECA